MQKKGFIRKILEGIFLAKVNTDKDSFKAYLRAIDNKTFYRKLFFGISDKDKGFVTRDPVSTPGALFIGGQGSGKSKALKSTLITTMCASSDTTVLILCDPIKGMGDYTSLFKFKENVAVAINDIFKFITAIDMVHEEVLARMNEFAKYEASDIYEYEKKTGNKLANIIIACEEFHEIPMHPKIDFFENKDEDGTTANKMKKIARVGRSYGICYLAATQRATQTDFPSDLKAGISTVMAFQLKTAGDASAVDLPHASEIKSTQRGRCAYEDGFIQYPWILDDVADKLLKKYYKPLKAKLLKNQMKDYQSALQEEGNKGAVMTYSLTKVVQNIAQFDMNDVAEKILKMFDYKLEKQTNTSITFKNFAFKNGIKYAVIAVEQKKGGRFISSKQKEFTNKKAQRLVQDMQLEKCDALIVFSSGDIPMPLDKKSRIVPENTILIDIEDMAKIGEVLENKEQNIKEGKWDKLYNEISLVQGASKLEKVSEDTDDDEDKTPLTKKTSNSPVKRTPISLFDDD